MLFHDSMKSQKNIVKCCQFCGFINQLPEFAPTTGKGMAMAMFGPTLSAELK